DQLLYLGEQRAQVALRSATVRGGRTTEDAVLTPGDRVVSLFAVADNQQSVAVFGTSTSFPEIYAANAFAAGKPLTNLNPQTARWKLPQIKHITWKGANGGEVGGVLEL